MESSATFFYWQVHKIVCQQTNHGITQYSQHLVSAQQLCKSLYTGDQKKQSCPLLHGKIKSATVIQITTAQTDMKVCHYPPHPLLPKREKNKWQICYLTVPPPQKKRPPPKKRTPHQTKPFSTTDCRGSDGHQYMCSSQLWTTTKATNKTPLHTCHH